MFSGSTNSHENPASVTSAAPSMLIQLLVSRTRMGRSFMDAMPRSSGKPQSRGHQVRSEPFIKIKHVAVAVVLPFAEPGGVLAKRHPELGGRLIVAGRLTAGR